MKKRVLCCFLVCCLPQAASATESFNIGVGYNFRGNTDLKQISVGWDHELPFRTDGRGWMVGYSVELEGAVIFGDDAGGDAQQTPRLSVMPQAHLWIGESFRLTAGLGAGFMGGEVEFEDHDLGGSFLLNSKLGAEMLWDRWSIGYIFYHQSNAGIYDNNASLNMNCAVVSFHF